MSRFVAGAHYSSNNNTATGDIQSPEYNYASHQLPHSSVQNQRLRAKELTSKEPPLSQTEVRHYLQSPKHNSPRLLANELERNVKTGTSSDTEILFEPRLPLSDEPRQYFDNSNRRSSGSDSVQSTTTDESLSKHLQERELQEGHRPTMGTEFTIMRNLNERNITDRRQGRDEATLWSSDQSAEDQLSTDEELALKLHEEWNSPTIAKRTQSEDEDLELAAKIANILIDEVSTQQPSQNDVVFTQNTSSIEVQRLIFEQIRRDREQRRLNKSSHSGTQSPHQDITSTRETISKDVTPILAEQKQLQDSRDRSQRRKEAFERQFKDRASGRVEVTAADREHALNESLDQHALHGDERAQLQNTTSPFRPAQCTLSYSQQQHSPPTSPTDWELSQRQALMEYEEARMQRSSRLRVSLSAPVGSDHQNLYPWQHNRISQQLPRSDIYEDDYRRREDLLRRGQSMTEMAVRTGQSHIVMCHGCGNRLQAPGKFLCIEACLACLVISFLSDLSHFTPIINSALFTCLLSFVWCCKSRSSRSTTCSFRTHR